MRKGGGGLIERDNAVADQKIVVRNEQVKQAIIKHLRYNLKTRYGMFSNRQGELRVWFERHLDDILPMAFGPQDTDGRDIVNMIFVNGRSVKEVATLYGKSKTFIYNHINAFFDALIEALSDEIYVIMAEKALTLQGWRLRACPKCGGSMFYDDVGGVQHPGSEWCCLACGLREAHDLHPVTTREKVESGKP